MELFAVGEEAAPVSGNAPTLVKAAVADAASKVGTAPAAAEGAKKVKSEKECTITS
jgi:hypothetical protein